MKWPAKVSKLFRAIFCSTDQSAKPVIDKRGKFAGTIQAHHFPDHSSTSLTTGSTPKKSQAELDVLFGIYPDGKASVMYEADPSLRDSENVPLQEHPVTFFEREVLPFVPDAWMDPNAADEKDGGVGKKGYEINFNREFFNYAEPPKLEDIDRQLQEVERRILELLSTVTQ